MKISYKKLSLEDTHSVIEEAISNGVVAEVSISIDVIEGKVEYAPNYKKFEQMTMDDCASMNPDEEE